METDQPKLYDKPALTIEQHIQLLKSRGLIITEDDNAPYYLANISYYRLAGYWWPMQDDKINHKFKEGSKFCDVIALYRFDHELRMLIFDVLEKIEISLRTKLIYHCSLEYGSWWFSNTDLFQNIPELIKTLASLEEEVERCKDIFMKDHKKNYKADLRFPPAWKTLELTSFGTLSKLYGNLKNTLPVKNTIAKEFGTVNHTFLPSWLQSLAQIRNYCAHHSRLWNKNLPGQPKLLPNPPNPWIADVPKQHEFINLYVHLCCMKYLLDVAHPTNRFSEQLQILIEKYKDNVDPNALGLKPNWQNEALWKL